MYRTPQPRQSSIAVQARDPESAPVASEKAPLPRGDYTSLLIGGCIAAPLLGVGLALSLAQLDHEASPVASGLVGLFGAWLIPAMVHWFNDQTALGFRALFMPTLLALGATVVVAFLSFGVLTVAHVPKPDPEDGTVNRAVTAVEIGLVAAVIADIAWAVYDVLDSVPSHNRSHTASSAAFRFAVVPTEHGAAGLLSCRF